MSYARRSAPSAYPLSCPIDWKRTAAADRGPARFGSRGAGGLRSISVASARERLQHELDLLDAIDPILSTNMPLRLDGQPRSDRADPVDPGVAVYFRLGVRDVVLACDRWETVGANIAALAAHIGALRGQERWGVGSVEQAFTGYMALPAPAAAEPTWRELLGNPLDLGTAEAAFRRLMRTAHPDQGGSQAQAAALNLAIAEARVFFGG